MSGRANRGASEEFRIIVSNLVDPLHFLDFLKQEPLGHDGVGCYSHFGQEVMYGKKLLNAFVEFEREGVSLTDPKFLFSVKPTHIYHLDSCNSAFVENVFSWRKGYLKKCKADLISVSLNMPPQFYSVKKGKEVLKKPGQISGGVTFGRAFLGDVDTLDDLQIKTPPVGEILWEDTALKLKSFEELKGSKHLRYAWYKKQSISWKYIVKLTLLDAENMLLKFWTALEEDRDSLVDFLIYLLRGPNPEIENQFHLLIGGKFFYLPDIHNYLRHAPYEYYFKWHGKSSLIIYLNFMGKTYILAKVQFSFEGAKVEVSQMKGIVFHAQEYSQKNMFSLWDLIEDISKNFAY